MKQATSNDKNKTIAVITMMFLFGMIAFVTNLAAPIGVIWKSTFSHSANANAIGMLGNAMNFLAYLFMGIPSGKMLESFGYKRTAMYAIATGFAGILLQYASGTTDSQVAGFTVYLAGAFVSGIAVCMLNTVVNPMTNLIGGGGNKGNQLNLIGGTVNSLTGTLTPMLVGALIGTVSARTRIMDVNVVLYIAMAVFCAAFCVLRFLPITDPKEQDSNDSGNAVSPWGFRNFKFGALAIFLYVGVEVGIPGTLFFYISDTSARGGGAGLEKAAAVAGFVAATYWLLMLAGRFVAGFIADKVSSRTMLTATAATAIVLMAAAMATGSDTLVDMPVFTGKAFALFKLPLAALLLVSAGLCTSVMWSCIFNLSVEGLGSSTALGSGIFMTMVVGGGVMPLLQNAIADHCSYMISYSVPLFSMAFILYYAACGSKRK